MKPFFSSRIFWVLFLAFSVSAYAGLAYQDWLLRDAFLIEELLDAKSSIGGTRNNTEREFKVSIENFNARILPIVQKTIKDSLNEFTSSKDLRIPALLGRPYTIRDDETPFVFLDFYFDTAAFDLDRLSLGYRLRYRWKSAPDFVRFMNGGRNSEDFPIRCELQCKFQRQEVSDGFSETVESRFEFRSESDPFNVLYPAPLPPWPFADFINIARRGHFEGQIMRPSQECARMIHEQTGQRQIDLAPRFAVLDIRTRSHVLIKTPWGNGPMPDDAMIVTLDNFWYTADMTTLLRQGGPGAQVLGFQGIRSAFEEAGAEMEFEFERNVSARLADDQVEKGFLADLTALKQKVIDNLDQRGIVAKGINVSKVKQIRTRME